jgi:glycerol-3-phosphate dehydrogenase
MPNEVSSTHFDLIVIGAGINGAGIARDASRRGLKVLLIDKGDVGGGTSSWSTRLIHGGLRYLEHGELGLVRESLRERETLLRIAPHLVRPLPILVPLYRYARRGKGLIRAGMIAYDALSLGKSLPSHRMLSVAETLREAPGLEREDLVGAALYYDAQAEFPERLVLENVLSAVDHGARLYTYARVEKVLSTASNGEIQVEMSRGPEGGLAPALFATAPIVINAAGPWIDQLLRKTDEDSPRLIGGTKGSHLIVDPFPGAPQTAVYVEAETDGRPFFIIPWNNKYLIGTTDIRYEGNPDDAAIDEGEIDYLLRETNRVVPGARLTRQQILFTYSGIRPLPFAPQDNEAGITRRHFIREHPQLGGLLSIVGGKLTTYRSLAEETVDLVLEKLQRPAAKCVTDREPLPGALELHNFHTPGPQDLISERLLRIYGTRGALLEELVAADPSLATVFDEETGAIAAEVVFAFKNEFAQTLSDCLLRRTMVGLNSSRGLNALAAAVAIVQRHLGWTSERVEQEIAEYWETVNRRLLKISGGKPPS